MTSRERVEMTLRHEEPDRVPLDVWGSASRVNTDLYLATAKLLGIDTDKSKRLIRPGKDTMYEDYDFADALDSDFRHINIKEAKNYTPYTDSEGRIIDEWGIGRSIVGRFPTIVLHPLRTATFEELEAWKTPDPKDPGRYEGLRELARHYYEDTDKYVTACSANSGQVFDVCQYTRGAEEFFEDLYEDEDFARLLIKKINDYLIELNLEYLDHVGPYIQWLEFTSDFGSQHSSFISPKMFREYFKEPYTQLYEACKKKCPHIKIFMHSCGDVHDLIEEFIDCGVDIMNPIQPNADNMNTAELKKRYGDRVVFHGGIDIQQAIFGSDEDVKNEVKRALREGAPGGGFILSPANHIQEGTPPENVIALYRYAKEFGKYPINC